MSEDVGVLAEAEENGERGGPAERGKAAEHAVRFARHETELDDGEAAYGCEYKARKSERAEVALHCSGDEVVPNGGSHSEERNDFGKRDAVMQEA